MRVLALPLVFLSLSTTAAADENLLLNGDFEQGLAGWTELWTRLPGGKMALDGDVRHGGSRAVRIDHRGQEDWSLSQQQARKVEPGEIYELSAWVRVRGAGSTTLCVTPRDGNGKVTDWVFAGQTAQAGDDWQLLRSRFVVPPGVKTMLPRLIGHGPATVWLDDARLHLEGSVDDLRAEDMPETLQASNGLLEVALRVADGTLTVVDRRTNRRWAQQAQRRITVLGAKAIEGGFELRLLGTANMLPITATFRLDPQRPEILVQLTADGTLKRPLTFPHPFGSDQTDFLIMPINEGISYPAGDTSIPPAYYHLYGGHGLCMGWYGQTDLRRGVMTLVETPDDAGVRMFRRDELLHLAPQWVSQKGRFGPARRLRYVFFDDGGYVAMCKRYRQHAQRIGRLKTLAEKRAENPNVDLLVGAVNVWCWDRDAVAICRELQAAGIRRILWSHRCAPETLRALNAMGILTSRYDIFQDVMDPANFPNLRGVHPDWTTRAWPKDLMLGADGDWVRGWRVKGKDDQWYSCGVLCDRQAVAYARQRIPPELKTHPYRCRFIDTTTASPWRECYHEDHPMTRSDSRRAKMELLRFVSGECGLVTGSETGHEAAVPYVHYFEGMLSLGPYRIPDAGRKMGEIWDEVPPRVAKFQTGPYYRLPLWELVYHDCVVAQWYWGDYNNKLPAVWDRRDLINALYGTPPMFMFNRRLWQENRDRFVRSYRTATEVARATGYAEMLSHAWLSDDHTVQQTRFAGGVTVTVNFGEATFTLPDGKVLKPLSRLVEGLAAGR